MSPKRGVYRRRHRKDGNQDAIVEFYRRAGATVEIIGEPTDLLVGLGEITDPVEVKTLDGQLNPDQEAFRNRWRGSLWLVRSIDDASMHIRSLRRRSSLLGASSKLTEAS